MQKATMLQPEKRIVKTSANHAFGQERRVVVLFEYIGNSELNVHGLVTGKQYTFSRHGAVAEVDPRDRNLFLAMPSLRQL